MRWIWLLASLLAFGAACSSDSGTSVQADVATAHETVNPVIADLEYDERVAEIGRVVVDRQTWALSELPDTTRSRLIATGEAGPELDPLSGEVLLLDGEEILASVPLPGVPPSFITSGEDAVYVGRIGDGGYPFSALVRIRVPEHTIDRLYFDRDSIDPVALGPEWSRGTDDQFDLFTAARYADVFS